MVRNRSPRSKSLVAYKQAFCVAPSEVHDHEDTMEDSEQLQEVLSGKHMSSLVSSMGPSDVTSDEVSSEGPAENDSKGKGKEVARESSGEESSRSSRKYYLYNCCGIVLMHLCTIFQRPKVQR